MPTGLLREAVELEQSEPQLPPHEEKPLLGVWPRPPLVLTCRRSQFHGLERFCYG